MLIIQQKTSLLLILCKLFIIFITKPLESEVTLFMKKLQIVRRRNENILFAETLHRNKKVLINSYLCFLPPLPLVIFYEFSFMIDIYFNLFLMDSARQ